MRWPFRRSGESGNVGVTGPGAGQKVPSPQPGLFLSGVLAALSGWRHTDCPLCLGPSRRGRMCQGCLDDTFYVRQARNLCMGCGDDLVDRPYSTVAQDGALRRRRCHACTRGAASFDWLICAFDAGFPVDLMLDRFSVCRTDLALAPVIADRVLDAMRIKLSDGIVMPSNWVALPATPDRLQACQCNPAQELALALGRRSLTQVREKWLARFERVGDSGTQTKFEASPAVRGHFVTLVLDRMESRDLVESAAKALRVAGAQQVGVICAAWDPSVWHNHDHVSCDPG